MTSTTTTQPTRSVQYTLIVGGVALAAALVMVLVVFRMQGMVANEGDPYHYGQIAREFLDHGFTKLTRRSASLYPQFIALVYWLGGSNLTVELLQCLFHMGTCLLAFSLGSRLYNRRAGLLAGLFCALHPMLLRYVGDLHMETP